MLDDILKERFKRREQLIAAGSDPYPATIKRTALAEAVLKDFAALLKKKTKLTLAGRVIGSRDQGNLIFADLSDASGKIQIILKKDNLKNYKEIKAGMDIGDFLEVSGIAFKTARGEKSLEVKSARIITKSIRPLPSGWHGFKDVEERFRKRYLDLLFNPDVKDKAIRRSEIIRELRDLLAKEGFLEVETPILQPVPGGAKARPFVTHHNALDTDLYLRIAPELYLKRLLVGGLEKIFEIGRNFRNEGMDRDHNPEFTMLEMYWAYQDYKGLMKFVQKMLKKYIPGKWSVVTFAEIFKKHSGKDYKSVDAKILDEVFKHEVRPKIISPTFVIDYPESIMALAKLKPENSSLTESFQLIVDGAEIVKGFSEMNDPVIQRAQMERQEKAFRAGDQESTRVDEDFLEALEYGMPPAAGLGIGIDRLIAVATKTNAVKEIILFPMLKPKE
ncbi:MAG: lysyl-tRNA synthetase, class II [Parcubacteria group bacterium Gr01-1014_3]|nr:MAG: lysyl-tRNA synthetase, class II [Parcubacteria group bacterium Gr01-1014_3]